MLGDFAALVDAKERKSGDSAALIVSAAQADTEQLSRPLNSASATSAAHASVRQGLVAYGQAEVERVGVVDEHPV